MECIEHDVESFFETDIPYTHKKNHGLQKYDLDFFCSNNIFVGCTKNAKDTG